MKRKLLFFVALMLGCIIFTSGIEISCANDISFSDINEHWAKDSIERAVEDGIIKGFDDGTMKPDDKITEAQMITIICRILNLTEQADLSSFKNLTGSWYEEEIEKAVALGIICTDDIYRVDSNMTRKDAFIMMSKAFQLDYAEPDMEKSYEYADFFDLNDDDKRIFASLINCGYINGWDGKIQLNSEVTRAEFVTLLYRIAGKYVNSSFVSCSDFSDNTVVSGDSFLINGINTDNNIWLDSLISDVGISNSNLNKLFVRSNNISSIKIENSKINRLVIAARTGDFELNCTNIYCTVIGDGSGVVSLNPAGNVVEVTGKGRKISLNGQAQSVLISGDYNNVYLSSLTYADNVEIFGTGNKVIIDSNVNKLAVNGSNNSISGQGTAYNLIMNSDSSDVEIHSDSVTKQELYKESKFVGNIEAPDDVSIGNYLNLYLNLSEIPVGEKAKITWYKDGKPVDSRNIILTKNTKPEFSYYIDYSYGTQDYCKIYCEIEYLENDGTYKKVTIPEVKIHINKGLGYLLSKIKSQYTGDNTTDWAISNNISDLEKEEFVNESSYSSLTEYLIWVNIGTQYASVYKGSEGNWDLIRSFLVSTGENQSTPIGVFKTAYKKSYITTEDYTVKPLVYINKDNLCLQSRLYVPGTIILKSNNNGIGYPEGNGNIRMNAEDIQWVYDNVPNGTTVVIY